MTLVHGPVAPSEMWTSWATDPGVLLAIAAASVLYARGLRLLRRPGGRVPPRRAVAFYGALALTLVTLSGPVDGLASTLFSAHMAQHLALMLVVAPLLVYARPVPAIVHGLPDTAQRFLQRRATVVARLLHAMVQPVVATALHVVVMWAWHLPALYEAALRNDAIHAAEHVSFLATAAAFWTAVLFPSRREVPRLAYGGSMLCVFVAGLGAGALGALLTFATTPLYPIHRAGVILWDTTLLADQRWAGLVMWVPAGTVYLVTFAGLFLAWMAALDEHMRASEAPDPAGPAAGRVRG